MKHYYFYHNFEDDSVQKLFEYADKMEDDLTIYLDSDGGSLGPMATFIRFVNNNREKITLIASGSLWSAAFLAFFKCRCSRIICDEARGMFHLPYQSICINSKGDGASICDQMDFSRIKSREEYTQKFMKDIGLSEEQIRRVNKGEDIEFNNTELQEILDRQVNENS